MPYTALRDMSLPENLRASRPDPSTLLPNLLSTSVSTRLVCSYGSIFVEELLCIFVHASATILIELPTAKTLAFLKADFCIFVHASHRRCARAMRWGLPRRGSPARRRT